MFDFLKKERTLSSDSEKIKKLILDTDEEPNEKADFEVGKKQNSSNASQDFSKVLSEIDRLKAGQEAFQEVRKSFIEQFSRISEQLGELRSMILDRDKTIQEIELKAVKSADLVETVQPEKFMTQIQKLDAKTEALKANIEGNESIMERVMDELKEAKKKIEFFRGVEEIISLSEEIKKDLVDIKKIESKVEINADKVGTIYTELRKKVQVVDSFESDIEEIKAGIAQNTKDTGFLKEKITGLADKSEVDALVEKVQRYVDVLKQLEKKSSLTRDIDRINKMLEGLS